MWDSESGSRGMSGFLLASQALLRNNFTHRKNSIMSDKAQVHHEIAANFAKAEKSDPFAYDRVRSHLTTGVANLNSYQAEWHKETRVVKFGEYESHFEVNVPHNMKRA